MLDTNSSAKPNFNGSTTSRLQQYSDAQIEHDFAKYIRIIGRGPRLSRPLNLDEMRSATHMIMDRKIEHLQLGAFLCILRMRAEIPEEGAGFVLGARDKIKMPENMPKIDLEWPTYSGKTRQLPWYLLAIFTLVQNGIKINMQGTEKHTKGRLFTSEVLAKFGIKPASSIADGARNLDEFGFNYLPLNVMSPVLQEIIELKWVLGLRSPINTFARMINPYLAPYEIQTVFHPAYLEIHRETAKIVGQPHMVVFKGEGGECERRPHKRVNVMSLHDGHKRDEIWNEMMFPSSVTQQTELRPDLLVDFWKGDYQDEYGYNALIGTIAIILQLLGKATKQNDALNLARDYWAERNKSKLGFIKI